MKHDEALAKLLETFLTRDDQLVIVNTREVVSMLAELEIIPIGTNGPSLSAVLAQVATLIDQSGLEYRVGSMGTVVEGDWDRLMGLAKQCHQAALKSCRRVMTMIRIDDRADKPGAGRIVQKIQSLEAKVGKPLRK